MPVNPHGGELLGVPVVRSLVEVDGPVDVVEVFRPASEAPQIAREAVKVGAKVLWLQLGIESQEAKQVAEGAGLVVVMNRCMGRPTASSAWDRGPDRARPGAGADQPLARVSWR